MKQRIRSSNLSELSMHVCIWRRHPFRAKWVADGYSRPGISKSFPLMCVSVCVCVIQTYITKSLSIIITHTYLYMYYVYICMCVCVYTYIYIIDFEGFCPFGSTMTWPNQGSTRAFTQLREFYK